MLVRLFQRPTQMIDQANLRNVFITALQWLHCWLPIKPFPDVPLLDQLPNWMLEVEVPSVSQLAAGALQCV